MNPDAFPALSLSARSGHGDPRSKLAYIHQFELLLAACSQKACPAAWVPAPANSQNPFVFEDLLEGQLAKRGPIPSGKFGTDGTRRADELTLLGRAELLWNVQNNMRFDAVAAIAQVEVSSVESVIQQTMEALIELGMTEECDRDSPLNNCITLKTFKVPAAVLRENKHAALTAHLEHLINEKQWDALGRIWRDWRICRKREWLSLMDGRPAARFIQVLLDAGLPHGSLAVVSARRSAPLPVPVANMGLATGIPVKPYRGRPHHRLVMTAHGVSAAEAKAGSVTMIGVHWLFVVLVSALISKGQL